jgi:tetratricopeptide (TPR) repeat protein
MGSYEWAWACVGQALALSHTIGTPLFSAVCLDSQAMVLMELGKYDLALEKIQAALQIYDANDGSLGPSRESLGRRGAIQLLRGNIDGALSDLGEAAQSQVRSGDRVILTDTLSYLALAQAGAGDQQKALATSSEALRVLEEIEWTGYQPQRVFWHHYQILELLGREPRINYLQRAVEFVDAQAATLSKAQAKRLRTNVPLNSAILSAWGRASTHARQTSPDPQPSSVAS